MPEPVIRRPLSTLDLLRAYVEAEVAYRLALDWTAPLPDGDPTSMGPAGLATPRGWDNDRWRLVLAAMGPEVCIGHHVVFTSPERVRLGNRVRIDPFTLVTGSLETGDNVHICAGAVLGGRAGIKLGDWTHVGYHSRLFSASEDYDGPVNDWWGHTDVDVAPIVMEAHSGVASNVTVMPGVVLPEGCKIGADSFVPAAVHERSLYREDRGGYLKWSIYYGKPARLIRGRSRGAILERVEADGFLRDRP